MAKFFGIVGYVENVESDEMPGVYVPVITEKKYKGELTRVHNKFQTSEGVNDNINITTEISIVADDFAISKWNVIRYVEYMGVKWKVTDVEPKRPRLLLTVGGVYNG